MDHASFVEAWRADRVRVDVDARVAAQFVSARLLLPFVAVAVIGLGIALVFWGWLWGGLAVGALGIIVPRAIKRHAGHFLLSQILTDPPLFESAVRAGALHIVAVQSGDDAEGGAVQRTIA